MDEEMSRPTGIRTANGAQPPMANFDRLLGSFEPQKNTFTFFHYTGCLFGIFIIYNGLFYNPL